MDAGYYDNYGIDVATNLLNSKDVRDWIVQNCSGILIIETQAFPENPAKNTASTIERLFWWITGPITGILSARGSSQIFRNREQLRLTRDLYGLALSEHNSNLSQKTDWRQKGRDFVEIVTFVCTTKATMSWHLTDADHAAIIKAASEATAPGTPDMTRLFRLW